MRIFVISLHKIDVVLFKFGPRGILHLSLYLMTFSFHSYPTQCDFIVSFFSFFFFFLITLQYVFHISTNKEQIAYKWYQSLEIIVWWMINIHKKFFLSSSLLKEQSFNFIIMKMFVRKILNETWIKFAYSFITDLLLLSIVIVCILETNGYGTAKINQLSIIATC